MPHCIIEATENILIDINVKLLMKNVSNAIFSLGCFSADDIKVRLYPVKYSFLGIKEQDHSYVTAEIQILDNKSDDQLDELSVKVQKVLSDHFNSTSAKISITTQISFLNSFYKRFKNF